MVFHHSLSLLPRTQSPSPRQFICTEQLCAVLGPIKYTAYNAVVPYARNEIISSKSATFTHRKNRFEHTKQLRYTTCNSTHTKRVVVIFGSSKIEIPRNNLNTFNTLSFGLQNMPFRDVYACLIYAGYHCLGYR